MSFQATELPQFGTPDAFQIEPELLNAPKQEIGGLASAGVDLAQRTLDQLDVLSGYVMVFAIAFLVTVLTTPLVRRLAVANGIVDHPSEARKIHKLPIAYLGGVAVYLGIIAALVFSYIAVDISGLINFHPIREEHLIDGFYIPVVPPWIALGMTSIVLAE